MKSTPKTNGRHLPMPYEHAPIGIVESSLDGRYLNVNEEFCRILGHEKEELLKGSIRDFTFAEDYPLDSKLHEQLIAGEIPFYRFEKRYLRKDGELIWTELTRSLVRDAKGKALYVVSTVLDINDRKKAEAQVKWQANLLAELGDAVLVTDENFVFTSWNRAAEKIYGWKAEEVLGKNAQDILQTEFFASTREAARQEVTRVGSFSGEFAQRRKDGTQIIIEGKVMTVRDEDGNIVGYVSVNRDVTERKQAEMAVRESQQRFAATYQYAPIGIVECSLDAKYLNVNDEFCRLLGYQKDELIGHDFMGITHEDDYAIDIRLHQKLVAGEIPYYRLEKRYIRKDGSVIWAEITRSLVCSERGEPLYSIGAVLDMSERKHVESVLRESAERLRLATEAARMFNWEWDFSRRTYTLTDNFEQVVGFSAGLLPKGTLEPLLKLSPAEEVQIITEAARKAIAEHSDIQSLQYRMIDPASSQIVWLELSGKIVYDEDGKPVRMFGVAQNITERKKTQEEIAVVSRMPSENPNPVMRLTPDGKVLYTNNACQHLLNISIQDHRTVPLKLQEAAAEAFAAASRREIELEQNGRSFSFTLAPILEAGYINLYGNDITERKQIEQTLARERELMQRLFETMPVMVSIYDADTKTMRLNGEFERALGWRSDEVTVVSLLEALYPDPDYRAQVLERMAAAGRNDWVEVQLRTRNGRSLDSLWSNISISKDDQLVTGIALGIDITERKRVESAIKEYARQQEALYQFTDQLHRTTALQNVFEAALDAILSALQCDRASILLYDETNIMHFVAWRGLSDEYRQATDGHSPWTPDTVNPEPICMDDVATADLSDSLRATIKREGIGALSFIPLVSNGKLIGKFMVYFNQPHAFSEGEVDLSLTIAHQLAFGIERKRAEEQLRAKESELEDIINQTPFMLTRCTRDLRYRFVSRAYAEMIGRTPEEMAGKQIVEIMGEEGLETISPYVEQVLQGEPVEYEAEVSFQGVGTPFLHVAYTPDRDEQGNVIGWFASIIDISARKRAEEVLRASESLYRTIARSIPGGGVYVVDKDFRYLVAEGAVTEAFGLSREMLEGRTVTEAFPDERGVRMEERLRQNFAGETVSFETKYNGRVYWTQQAPLQDSIGQAIILTVDITERKQMEDALRQSEERFAQFMHHLPGLAWIKDAQGRYMYANAAAEKAFNTSREKLYGKTDEEVFPPDVATQFKKNDEQALGEGKGIQVVETLEQEGILHYSLVNKFPIPGLDGNIALIGGTAFDITDRKKAEEALRESEERLSAILRQATAGIVRKDPKGRLIFVNQAFCNMLDYTEEELLGKLMWDLMVEEDRAENQTLYRRMMMEGVPFKLERRLIRRDGSVIWLDASVSPIMDAEGKPQSAVTVEVDITARKQAEEALQQLNQQLEERVLSRTAKLRDVNQTLREEITERKRVEEALRTSETIARANEAKLQTLFELLPVGVSFLDPEGQIIQINSALANILKLSKERLLNQEYRSRTIIRANGTPMPPTEFASSRALAEDRTIYNTETGIVLENGEVVWTSVSAAPVDVPDVGVVVATVDITDSKRAEQALKESHERLRILSQRLVEVQEEERRAIARELHDRVGQTLAALNINLIIISSQLTGEGSQQISARLNDSMKLVAETIALVRDVMTDLRPAVLDDYGLEAALEAHLAQFIARYDINAKLEKPDQPVPRMIPSIEMTFLRIAQEALMNIARHAQATQVDLSLRQKENAVSMTIHDNGTGILSWQRANRPGNHGLTIMRERAEAFGGTLQVKSVPGEGTSIDVSIPFHPPGQSEELEEKSG